MAWQSDPTVRITLHFRDDDGASSQHIIHVPASALAVAGDFAAAYAALFAPVSNCALWKVGISLRYMDNADPVATAGSSQTRRSIFVFGTLDGGRYTLSLPGVVAAKLLQPPDPYAWVGFDLADPDIAALVAAMTTGIDGTAPCAPWTPDPLGWNSSGGSWGGGGSGGSWGGGGSGGSWGGGGSGGSWIDPVAAPDFTWTGCGLTTLLTAYWGYERANAR